MRISDWSSDVCSSDLNGDEGEETNRLRREHGRKGRRRQGSGRNRAKRADEARERRMALRRRYKIQDAIQRRQVLLVKVGKEERGNKGEAVPRSEARRGGKECVIKWRSRWPAHHETQYEVQYHSSCDTACLQNEN